MSSRDGGGEEGQAVRTGQSRSVAVKGLEKWIIIEGVRLRGGLFFTLNFLVLFLFY